MCTSRKTKVTQARLERGVVWLQLVRATTAPLPLHLKTHTNRDTQQAGAPVYMTLSVPEERHTKTHEDARRHTKTHKDKHTQAKTAGRGRVPEPRRPKIIALARRPAVCAGCCGLFPEPGKSAHKRNAVKHTNM